MAAYFDTAAAPDRIGGLSAHNLLYSTGRNPRCQHRLHVGSALYGVEVFHAVLYRQSLRRTTLKTPVYPENLKLFTDLTFVAFLFRLDRQASPSSDTPL
jgi:hypothetical protein